jgi:hypothetical protein
MRKRVGPLRIASSREACILRGDVDTPPEIRSRRSTARFIHGLRDRLAPDSSRDSPANGTSATIPELVSGP